MLLSLVLSSQFLFFKPIDFHPVPVLVKPKPAPIPEPAPKPLQCGYSSWYDQGEVTANGEDFNPWGLTAAHRYMKFNQKIKVVNLDNNKQTIVRINDRGPFISGRILDLSAGAFDRIAPLNQGVAHICIYPAK